MPLPQVTMTFLNGGLGIIPGGAGRTQAKVGASCGGTPNVAVTYSSPSAARTALIAGPLCEAVYHHISVSGAPVTVVPCVLTTDGSVTATLTQSGTGTGVVTTTETPRVQILVKCPTGGTLGTAAFQFSVDGGAYSSPVTSTVSSFVYRVPGTFTTLTFAAATYRAGDVYTISTTGTVSASVPSGGPDTITQASSPVDSYQLEVTIALGGARGTAQFTYSLDGGAVVSAPIVTAATYVIPGAGITLAFSNDTYVLGDVYTGTATPPSFSSTTAGNAIDAALADSTEFEGLHIVGTPASAADALTMASMLDGKMQGAATTLLRYVFGVCECPSVEADATVKSTFASFTSTNGRVQIPIGLVDLMSRNTGLTQQRNCAWSYCSRLAASKMSEHPGKVLLGGLPDVKAIYTSYGNAATADTFDSARFVTVRTIRGVAGYYITRGNTMDLPTSDYSYVQNVRVIDRAASIAMASFTQYLNEDWRINPDDGKLDERDISLIEGAVETQLRTALTGERGTAKDEVSSIKGVVLDPDSNLLSDKTLTATISIVPKGYSEYIDVSIGFINPQIA